MFPLEFLQKCIRGFLKKSFYGLSHNFACDLFRNTSTVLILRKIFHKFLHKYHQRVMLFRIPFSKLSLEIIPYGSGFLENQKPFNHSIVALMYFVQHVEQITLVPQLFLLNDSECFSSNSFSKSFKGPLRNFRSGFSRNSSENSSGNYCRYSFRIFLRVSFKDLSGIFPVCFTDLV